MGRKRGVQYRAGSNWISDDRSGFSRRVEDTQQEWNQLQVGKNLWEIRQPQDLVRGVPDNQSVAVARPIPPAVFVGPVYAQTSAAIAIGATFIPLNAINGFTAGYKVGVMLDTGVLFNTTQVGPASSTGITIANPMPLPAQSGNDVVSYGATGP